MHKRVLKTRIHALRVFPRTHTKISQSLTLYNVRIHGPLEGFFVGLKLGEKNTIGHIHTASPFFRLRFVTFCHNRLHINMAQSCYIIS